MGTPYLNPLAKKEVFFNKNFFFGAKMWPIFIVLLGAFAQMQAVEVNFEGEAKAREALNELLRSGGGADLLQQITLYLNASQNKIQALETQMAKSQKQIASVQTALSSKVSSQAMDRKISSMRSSIASKISANRKRISSTKNSLTSKINNGDGKVMRTMKSKISALQNKFNSLKVTKCASGWKLLDPVRWPEMTQITFPSPFTVPPKVVMGLCSFEGATKVHLWYNTFTTTGFKVGNSVSEGGKKIQICYMACGY